MVRVASANPATSAPVPEHALGEGRHVGGQARAATAPTSSDTRRWPTSTRRVNTHSGSTGSAARRSTRTKTTRSTRPAAKMAMLDRRTPRPGLPALEQAEDQQRRRRPSACRRRRSRCDCRVRTAVSWKLRISIHGREQAQRDVDEEDPPPADRYSENTPPRVGPTTADIAPHAGQVALRLGAFGEGVDVAGDGHAHRLDGAGAETLHRPERDQRGHAPRDPAQHRAEQRTARCRGASRACGRRCRPACRRSAPTRPGPAGRSRTATGTAAKPPRSPTMVEDRGGDDRRIERDQRRREHQRDQDRSAFRTEPDVDRGRVRRHYPPVVSSYRSQNSF